MVYSIRLLGTVNGGWGGRFFYYKGLKRINNFEYP